jgi:uncharacterized Zn finger protein
MTTMANNWGEAWVNHVEGLDLDEVGLDRGRNYAMSEWRLELEIEPGLASTDARAGRRVVYEARLHVAVLTPEEIEVIVDVIASSTSATAALLDGDLDMSLLSASAKAGVDLMPPSVMASCDCRHQGAVCRHVGAIVYLLGDAIEADSFELLRLRGIERTSLVKAVSAARGGAVPEIPDGTQLASAAFQRETGDLPNAPAVPENFRPMAPFPTEPPPSAPFTAVGLGKLGADAAERALAFLKR